MRKLSDICFTKTAYSVNKPINKGLKPIQFCKSNNFKFVIYSLFLPLI